VECSKRSKIEKLRRRDVIGNTKSDRKESKKKEKRKSREKKTERRELKKRSYVRLRINASWKKRLEITKLNN
jgi:hypothetical protein